MRYSELCQAFYISQTEGGFKEYTAEYSISEMLIRFALKEESCDVLSLTPSSFSKWFSGENGQRASVWKAFKRDYIEECYVRAIEPCFNTQNLVKVARKLGIQFSDERELKTRRFAVAIARQMIAFAEGKGNADNLIKDVYAVGDINVDFSDYIQKATERYNVMKLVGGDEVSLENYFVCNTLGEKPRVFADKTKIRCKYLNNATIEGIRNMYAERLDNKKTILIGSGGSGKTLMLQHLFLDGVEKYPETGILPIFLELRYFTNTEDISSYIVKTVNAKDGTFTEEIAHQLLLEGKCPILMDGLDEIDPSDIKDFQLKLNAFIDKYSRTQIILASRECDAITGMVGYVKLYVWPFDNDQSIALIDRILKANGEEDAKTKIREYIDNGFIKRDGAFASHPMLLTFVATNYPKFESFYGNHLLFYRVAYDALLKGHDDNKKPYDRVFHSVDNPEQFSVVFREFCGETYRQGVLKFDTASFDRYFSELKSYQGFENPYKMNAKSFRQDACATACMMYEKEYNVWYIDPGFQEFLFAEYYSQQDKEKVKELGMSLRGQSLGTYKKLDAFEMLYNFSADKVKVGIFLPFLDEIFNGKVSEEEAFTAFLMEGFGRVAYTVIDKPLIEKYEKRNKMDYSTSVVSINEPGTIILSYILKLLDEKPTFTYLTTEHSAGCEEFAKNAFTGEHVYVGKELEDQVLLLTRNLQTLFADKEKFANTYPAGRMLRDEQNEIICFGYEYEIEAYDLYEEPEKFSGVIQTMMREECDIYRHIKGLRSTINN